MNEPQCIAVDWGTSSFRAALLDQSGDALERVAYPLGILAITDANFAGALDQACGTWRRAHPGIPVIMSGMIGSQQGWVESAYLEAPCKMSDLVNGVVAVPGCEGEILIMPGVSGMDPNGAPEIMRGEETQISGLGARHGITQGICCLPGTHSKWVRVASGYIETFATFMTGECFALLKTHSILGRLMEQGPDAGEAFRQGLLRAETSGGLLHHLFSVRTMGITRAMPRYGLEMYLAGQLIGSEIAGARALFGEIEKVQLIAAGTLGSLYAMALEHFGLGVTQWDPEEAASAGLWSAAVSMNT